MDFTLAGTPRDVSPVSSTDNLPSTSAPRRSSQSSGRGRSHQRLNHDRLRQVSASSSTSSEQDDNDYHTDFTTPAASDTGAEDTITGEVEEFRDREYPMLKGNVYLDTAGSALPTKSLLMESAWDLATNLYGNPHSTSAPSALASHKVDTTRTRVLRFFNADPADWDLIWTANATAAIKLVIESLRDYAAASNTPIWYGYHKDAHTSLVGIRELTKMHRCFLSDDEVDLWINSGGLGGPRARQIGLFAYPGQSNMTGRRLPYNWCGGIRRNLRKAKTYTLFDAAALASTAQLDLSDASNAPDFVAASFYKIFGKPDIGCLLVRKESREVFDSRRYFGGGTVEMIISLNDTWHAKKDSLYERLEDGTVPFHSIVELDHALDVHERLFGKMPMRFVGQHTGQLAKGMFDRASRLRHKNGAQVIRVYRDEKAQYGDPSTQGATMAFNVVDPKGRLWGYDDVEAMLNDSGIYVRSGSLCNPGGMASYLGWSAQEMRRAYDEGHRCSNPVQVLMGKATGVVRASLGAHSIADDVDRFIRFLEENYVDKLSEAPLDTVKDAQPLAHPPHAASVSGSDRTITAHTTPNPNHNFPHSPPITPGGAFDKIPRSDSATHGLPHPSTLPDLSRPTSRGPISRSQSQSQLHHPHTQSSTSYPANPPLPFSTLTNALTSRTRNRKSLHNRAAKGMGMEVKVDVTGTTHAGAPPTPVSAASGGGGRDGPNRLRKEMKEYGAEAETDGEDDGVSATAPSGASASGRRRFGRSVVGLLGGKGRERGR
ncbi:molybdenum cofactor sulfurase [Elsinoe australis]|uniref:Molybdenum cofactor sulfurase n=1 Tax=Elsinoe australis TaxID=40998 RepID=A0A4V6DUJ1_9PEZI|nr:molybdenum cofactor sulfurase [Elsinoe australis]